MSSREGVPVAAVGRGYRRHVLRHVALGIRNRYPPCCVARFATESLIRPNAMQAIERGVVHRPDRDSVYVPCGVLHHGQRC